MTENRLTAPRRIAELTPDNLRVLIEDMGDGPGWYIAADLYRWYVAMCKDAALEPVAQNKFGAVLRELGYQSSRRRFCGDIYRCWLITKQATR